jgi:parallel beta-helix repeat protein
MRSTILLAAVLALGAGACGTEHELTAPASRRLPAIGSGRPATDHVVVTNLACGDLITTDVRLEADLTCPGDALFVGADGIRINLNGHIITGAATGVGITVRGRIDVTIHGGTIMNFVTGVFVSQSTGVTVKDNAFTQNREAVFLIGSSGNVVKANVAWENSSRGIMLRPTTSGIPSTDNLVVANVLIDNPSGILIFGQSGNTLKGNTISGSSVGAFDLTGGGGTGNVIKENDLSGSAAGIRFGTGWTGNLIIGNTIHTNTCGLAGPSASNTYKDYVFSSNGSDVCP